LRIGFKQIVALRRQRLDVVGGRLSKPLLEAQLDKAKLRLDDAPARLGNAMRRLIEQQMIKLESVIGRMSSYQRSEAQILERGFVKVFDADGKIVESRQSIVSGDALTLEFHDGKLGVVARGAPSPSACPAEPAKPKKPSVPGQGSLL